MIGAMWWSGIPGDPPMIQMMPGHEPEELCDVITDDDDAPIVPMAPELNYVIQMPGGGVVPGDPQMRRRALAELGMTPAQIETHTNGDAVKAFIESARPRLRVIGPVGGQRCPHGYIDWDACVDCRH